LLAELEKAADNIIIVIAQHLVPSFNSSWPLLELLALVVVELIGEQHVL
jgi:hypothetical protein